MMRKEPLWMKVKTTTKAKDYIVSCGGLRYKMRMPGTGRSRMSGPFVYRALYRKALFNGENLRSKFQRK